MRSRQHAFLPKRLTLKPFFVLEGGAVIGGQLLAMKISQRTVAFLGGAVFIMFALHNVIFGVDKE